MKKLWNKLQADKKKHLIGGLIVMIVSTIILLFFGLGFSESLENAVAIVFAVALAKEVYDFILYMMKKKPKWNPLGDIIATVAIPLICQLINILI